MKRFVLMLIAVAGLAACNQAPSYKLTVKLSGATGKAYLTQRVNGAWMKRDSSDLKNGEYAFKGSLKNPEMFYLAVGSQRDRLPFFLENSVITITGAADSLSKAKVSGSAVQDELNALHEKLDQIDAKAMALYKESKEREKEGAKAKADSLMALSDSIFSQSDNLQKDYIKAHPDSWVSPYLLGRIYYEMDADALDSYLKALNPKLDSVNTIITLKQRVDKLKALAVGQPAPDFTMNDPQGNPVKLSDIYKKNTYTLVDFWASWCGPCRRENPNVVAIYEKYKGKGFSVFGVSLDTDKDKWLKAIADDKLTWDQVSDLQGWKNEAAALYAVNSIPSNLLLDKDGKIVGRNLRGEDLAKEMASLLK